jgi:hypothetical protein
MIQNTKTKYDLSGIYNIGFVEGKAYQVFLDSSGYWYKGLESPFEKLTAKEMQEMSDKHGSCWLSFRIKDGAEVEVLDSDTSMEFSTDAVRSNQKVGYTQVVAGIKLPGADNDVASFSCYSLNDGKKIMNRFSPLRSVSDLKKITGDWITFGESSREVVRANSIAESILEAAQSDRIHKNLDDSTRENHEKVKNAVQSVIAK